MGTSGPRAFPGSAGEGRLESGTAPAPGVTTGDREAGPLDLVRSGWSDAGAGGHLAGALPKFIPRGDPEFILGDDGIGDQPLYGRSMNNTLTSRTLLVLAAVCIPATSAFTAPASPVPDLVVDANRDGRVDLTGSSDDAGEDTAGVDRGALVLANLDDDSRRCRVAASKRQLYLGGDLSLDRKLAACNDGADAVVNGPADALDLAALALRPMPQAPDGTSIRLTVEGSAQTRARLFLRRGDQFVPLVGDGAATVTPAELRTGAQLALEARDIVRNPAAWDGTIPVSVSVSGPGVGGTDRVVLRVAPVMLQHDLQAAQRVFAGSNRPTPTNAELAERTEELEKELVSDLPPKERAVRRAALRRFATRYVAIGRRAAPAFERSLRAGVASIAAQAPPRVDVLDVGDTWVQDIFEAGWASVPGPGGAPHTMRVLIRSANADGDPRRPTGLRKAGRVIFASLRGPDVAAIQTFAPTRSGTVDDSLNSTGNLEALPPYSTATANYPRGRMLWGSTDKRRPDGRFTRLLRAQGAQPPLTVDTSWLAVGHADETFHVVGAPNARGWTLMVADPRLAVQLLKDAKTAGAGRTRMFAGKESIDLSAFKLRQSTRTVNQVLADRKLLKSNAQAAGHIDRQVATLLAETGLRPDELVRVPVLFDAESGELAAAFGAGGTTKGPKYSAYSPGIANGLSLTSKQFIAPDPHGPDVNGRDIFQRATEDALRTVGVEVRFVENWDWLHTGGGEVHCGTNAFRDISGAARWWAPGPEPT